MTNRYRRATLATRAAYILTLLVAALTAAACGDASGPRDPDGGGRPAVALVTVAPGSRALAIGEMAELFAETKDASGRTLSDRAVAWSSTDVAVARVNSGGVVTAVGVGTATIVASSEGKQGSAQVTVGPSGVAIVTVDPSEASLLPGNVTSISAVGRDAGGRVVPGRPVAWTTADAAVATVDGGLVTAVAPGTTQITATIDGKSAATTVHVRASGIARVELSPATIEVPVDETRQLSVIAYDASGNRLPLLAPHFRWQTSGEAVATVTPGGLVGAIQPGTVTITATAFGHTATATVTVPAHEYTHDIAYLGPNAAGSGPAQIWIAPMAGGAHTNISLPGIDNFAATDQPAPSPDGTRIAFAAMWGDPTDGVVRKDIWVVNRDGTGLRRLTDDPAIDEQPAWSPDGSKIAFRSTRGGTDADIWVMNADGGNQVNITADESSANMNEEHPAWSPDGSRIAYNALVRPTGHGELWLMRADGSGKQRLTSDVNIYDWDPTWSPDGNRIAFVRVINSADIAILDVAGPNAGRFTTIPLPISQLYPAWSPDGRYIAFSSNHGGRFEIYTARADGRGVRARTESAVPGSFWPDWIRRP